MERRVKQRLVGAGILLLLVVVIVPELLSGPKPAATTVLPDPVPAPAATRTVTVPVDAVSDAPLAADPAPSNPTPPAASMPAVAAQATAAMPLENPPSIPTYQVREQSSESPQSLQSPRATSAESARPVAQEAWSVQLGSFASKPNAEKLVHAVGDKGYAPYIAATGSGAALRFRVRVGPFTERAAAERALAKLKSQGLAATLAPPSPR
jgi:DedD protein